MSSIQVFNLIPHLVLLITCGLCTAGCGSLIPQPQYTVGQIGVTISDETPAWVHAPGFDQELRTIVAEVEAVTGKPVPPTNVVFTWGLIDCGRPAYGCDTGEVQISVGFMHQWSPARDQFVDWLPQCLHQTALAHELVHRITWQPGVDNEASVGDLLTQISAACPRE
jgi:hypothetical protein